MLYHVPDNDLAVEDPVAAVASDLSRPLGESAIVDQAADFASAVERRFVDGRFRTGTRVGVFICTGRRRRPAA